MPAVSSEPAGARPLRPLRGRARRAGRAGERAGRDAACARRELGCSIAGLVAGRSGDEGARACASSPLHESVTVIPGLLDLTHVQNTGAAFGLLNAADFPYKPVVIALVAPVGARRRGGVRGAACRSSSGWRASAWRSILGGAVGNLIDRVAPGYVVDFVDVYWGGWHFWAFNVADAAITVGVAIMILDMLRPAPARRVHDRRLVRVPELFTVGPLTVYTYGVLLAAAYLLGLQFAMVARADARARPDARCSTSGIYIIISALVGAKLLLLVVDFDHFTSSPARAAVARAVGRRLLRRADPARSSWRSGTSGGTGCRSGRRATCSRRASRSATSSAGSGACSPAAATGSRRTCRGRSRSPNPAAAANVGTPLGVPLHPTQLYESGRRAAHPGRCCSRPSARAARSRAARSGSTCCSTAISRFVIEFYRGDPRGMVFGVLLDVAVHLGRARAAQPRDARAGCRGGRPRRRHQTPRGVPAIEAAAPERRDAAPRDRGHRRVRRASASTASSRRSLPGQSRSQLQRLIKDGHVAGRRARRRKPTRRCKAGRPSCVDVPEPIAAGARSRRTLPLDDPLRGRGPHRRRQAGRHGRAPGGRPRRRHAGQRAAAPRRRSERHRRRAAARASCTGSIAGTSGVMVVAKNDRGARGARAAVPRSRGREGIRRARLGRRAGGPAHRRADRARPGRPAEDVGARAAPRAKRSRASPAREHLPRRDARAGGDPHRPHASDSRAPERDRPSDRRRRALRRRRAGACRRTCARCCASSARSCTPRGSRSRIPTDGRRMEFAAPLPADLQTVLDEIAERQAPPEA